MDRHYVTRRQIPATIRDFSGVVEEAQYIIDKMIYWETDRTHNQKSRFGYWFTKLKNFDETSILEIPTRNLIRAIKIGSYKIFEKLSKGSYPQKYKTYIDDKIRSMRVDSHHAEITEKSISAAGLNINITIKFEF
jgi:hypothetical protein